MNDTLWSTIKIDPEKFKNLRPEDFSKIILEPPLRPMPKIQETRRPN